MNNPPVKTKSSFLCAQRNLDFLELEDVIRAILRSAARDRTLDTGKNIRRMGYKPGKGLGRDLQGISAPIEAKLRKGKGAIGLYGPEHKTAPASTQPSADDAAQKAQLHDANQWKKRKACEKKIKYVYKTIDEVKSEGVYRRTTSAPQSKLSKVKVIDMTGPEQRVLSGYHELHQQHTRPEEEDAPDVARSIGANFSVPELSHNLDLLVDMTEQRIMQNDRELRHENDRLVNMQHELEQLEETTLHEQNQEARLKAVTTILKEVEERTKEDCADPLTLSECADHFRSLLESYYEEYKMFGLSDLAITAICPLFKKHLEKWQPLKKPSFAVNVFKEWKDILEGSDGLNRSYAHHCAGNPDPYHHIVWESWMPLVRQTILSWSPRNCDPAIELLETWMPLLPPWIFHNVLDQFVLPRLQQEVEAWNPLTDTVPIHSWLHPWLPLMGSRLEPLYPPIRMKLSNALTNWHPSDGSAKLILEPWRRVFSGGTLEAFVVANILPKLAVALQGMVINPHHQILDVWHWVMAWEDMCPPSSMATLMEKTFFPQWLQVLCTWLQHNPNYEEVSKWYLGWKSLFSEALLAEPAIREQFKAALDIMNRAVSGAAPVPMGYPAPPHQIPPVPEVNFNQNRRDYEAMPAVRSAPSFANIHMSFKELIEQKAQEKNLLFMPIPNRFQEAKQVYRLGRIMLYIDRSVIFMFNGKIWVPTSMQSLLDMAG
ncbi:tuftelin-interacting protein 11-like isoform X2 [Ornithodoros turicata]|uniref:tuftelin-interacting protein 11-like isoform X2 n=1 Tax=Ornithodoros turicata TaxID=34597 RepID=UPI00313865E7